MSDPRVVETFSIFDADNSGSITTDELREVRLRGRGRGRGKA
jgi:Ca2+-binding EF-hand superfamily protein